jgi:peroxiredoxin
MSIRKGMAAGSMLAALALAGTVCGQAPPASASAPSATAPAQQLVAKTHLKVGDTAPDFKLKGSNGKTFKLSSYRNKKSVVLAFYVLAFTGG